MNSVDVRKYIHRATVPRSTFYYAEIDGRLYAGKHNKVLYSSIRALKSSLKQSPLWYDIVRVLAGDAIEYRQPRPSIKEQQNIKKRMWEQFIVPNGRVQIKSIEL